MSKEPRRDAPNSAGPTQLAGSTIGPQPPPSQQQQQQQPLNALNGIDHKLPFRVADYFAVCGPSNESLMKYFYYSLQDITRTSMMDAMADGTSVVSPSNASRPNGSGGSGNNPSTDGNGDAHSGTSAVDELGNITLPTQDDEMPLPPPSVNRRHSIISPATFLKAQVLARYPEKDHDRKICEFPSGLENFVFPCGFSLSDTWKKPSVANLVLTSGDGTRVYGTFLTFYQDLRSIYDQFILHQQIRASAILPGVLGLSPTPQSNEIEAERSDDLEGVPVALHTLDASSEAASHILSMWVPYVLCITSHWPFHTQFSLYLMQLFDKIDASIRPPPARRGNHVPTKPSSTVGTFGVGASSGSYVLGKIFGLPFHTSYYGANMHPVWTAPVERYIANLIYEIPLPPEGRTVVESRIFPTKLVFSRPPPNKPPLRDFSYQYLFMWLSAENIIKLFSAVTNERKILFVSDFLERLTIAAETIHHLLYPFRWANIYIPLIPNRLTDFICAPMPFMIGMHSSYIPDELMLDQVVVVFLDENRIEASNVSINPLHEARHASLIRALRKVVPDVNQPLRNFTASFDDSVVEAAFLKFFVKTLRHYRQYLEAHQQLIVEKFRKDEFLREHPEACQHLTEFLDTQMFQCFVDDRYESSAGAEQQFDVLYFDESIDKAENKTTPFLSDTSQEHSKEPVVALGVLTEGLSESWPIASYASTSTSAHAAYDRGWPCFLRREWFGVPRYVKPLVTAEELIHSFGAAHAAAARNASASASVGQDNASTLPLGGMGMLGDLSKLNMKFFADKRMYTQHFHTLRLKSSKQDALFRELSRFLTNQQALDEDFVSACEALVTTVNRNFNLHTGTSIDAAWEQILNMLDKQLATASESLRDVRDRVFVPFAAKSSEIEQRLRILFTEANSLEAQTGQAKTQTEKNKYKHEVQRSRYLQLVNKTGTLGAPPALSSAAMGGALVPSQTAVPQIGSSTSSNSMSDRDSGVGIDSMLSLSNSFVVTASGTLSQKEQDSNALLELILNSKDAGYTGFAPGTNVGSPDSIFTSLSSAELHKIINAHSDMEDASLALDQSEITFQSVLKHYDERMPKIIEELRSHNIQRIMLFQDRMLMWVHLKQRALRQQLEQLDILECRIKAIDLERDRKSFSDGTNDFWLRHLTPQNASVSASVSASTHQEDQKIDDVPTQASIQRVDPAETTPEVPSTDRPEAPKAEETNVTDQIDPEEHAPEPSTLGVEVSIVSMVTAEEETEPEARANVSGDRADAKAQAELSPIRIPSEFSEGHPHTSEDREGQSEVAKCDPSVPDSKGSVTSLLAPSTPLFSSEFIADKHRQTAASQRGTQAEDQSEQTLLDTSALSRSDSANNAVEFSQSRASDASGESEVSTNPTLTPVSQSNHKRGESSRRRGALLSPSDKPSVMLADSTDFTDESFTAEQCTQSESPEKSGADASHAFTLGTKCTDTRTEGRRSIAVPLILQQLITAVSKVLAQCPHPHVLFHQGPNYRLGEPQAALRTLANLTSNDFRLLSVPIIFPPMTVNEKLTYSRKLWGAEGFKYGLENCQSTKDTTKDMVLALDGWAATLENKSKRLYALNRTSVFPIDSVGWTHYIAWDVFKESLKYDATVSSDLSLMLFKLAFAMRIVKGELKQAKKRYSEQYIKLERELQAATDAMLKATDKCNRARQLWDLAETKSQAFTATARDYERNAQTIDRVGREYKLAEHHRLLAERDLFSTQNKHDISVSRLFVLLERKEKRASAEFQKCFWIIIDWLSAKFLHAHRQTEAVLTEALARIDDDADMTEITGRLLVAGQSLFNVNSLVSNPYAYAPAASQSTVSAASTETSLVASPSASSHSATASSSSGMDSNASSNLTRSTSSLGTIKRPDFGRDLAIQHMDTLLAHETNCTEFVKALALFFEELSNVEDVTVRMLKRYPFHIKNATRHPTIREAFVAFGQLMDAITSYSDVMTKTYRNIAKRLNADRLAVKDSIKARERRVYELRRTYEAAQSECERARRDHQAASELVTTLAAKVEAASNDESQKKGGFFTKSPYEVLVSRHEAASKDLERATKTLERKVEALQNATRTMHEEFAQIYQAMNEMERSRGDLLRGCLQTILEDRKPPMDQITEAMARLLDVSGRIDSVSDLRFVTDLYLQQTTQQQLALQRMKNLPPGTLLMPKIPTVVDEDVETLSKLERTEVMQVLDSLTCAIAERANIEAVPKFRRFDVGDRLSVLHMSQGPGVVASVTVANSAMHLPVPIFVLSQGPQVQQIQGSTDSSYNSKTLRMDLSQLKSQSLTSLSLIPSSSQFGSKSRLSPLMSAKPQQPNLMTTPSVNASSASAISAGSPIDPIEMPPLTTQEVESSRPEAKSRQPDVTESVLAGMELESKSEIREHMRDSAASQHTLDDDTATLTDSPAAVPPRIESESDLPQPRVVADSTTTETERDSMALFADSEGDVAAQQPFSAPNSSTTALALLSKPSQQFGSVTQPTTESAASSASSGSSQTSSSGQDTSSSPQAEVIHATTTTVIGGVETSVAVALPISVLARLPSSPAGSVPGSSSDATNSNLLTPPLPPVKRKLPPKKRDDTEPPSPQPGNGTTLGPSTSSRTASAESAGSADTASISTSGDPFVLPDHPRASSLSITLTDTSSPTPDATKILVEVAPGNNELVSSSSSLPASSRPTRRAPPMIWGSPPSIEAEEGTQGTRDEAYDYDESTDETISDSEYLNDLSRVSSPGASEVVHESQASAVTADASLSSARRGSKAPSLQVWPREIDSSDEEEEARLTLGRRPPADESERRVIGPSNAPSDAGDLASDRDAEAPESQRDSNSRRMTSQTPKNR